MTGMSATPEWMAGLADYVDARVKAQLGVSSQMSARYGTVTQAEPLQVQLPGETVPSGYTPACLYRPSVGDRVLVIGWGTQMVVVGPAGGQAIPVGLVAWFGKASPPPGWLACEGQAFSSVTYPDLYAYLGGTTMPDYRGQVLVGQKPGLFGTLGASVGAETHQLTVAQMPTHAHSYGTDNTGSLSSTGTNPVHGTAFNTSDYETSFSGGNEAHPNVQPSRVGKWLMSAGRVAA